MSVTNIGLEQELIVVNRKNNLALTATANADFTEGSYYPLLICDGVYSTRWSGFGNLGVSNVTLDLGAVSKLGNSMILWESNSAYSFSIYTPNDGENFTLYKKLTIPNNVDYNNYKFVFDFKGIEDRCVPLSVPATTYISAYEWEIWKRELTDACDKSKKLLTHEKKYDTILSKMKHSRKQGHFALRTRYELQTIIQV